MSLTLMYITNRPEVAQLAQRAGIDRIWVDMEYIGKEERQAGMNTVKSHHTIEDILRLRPLVDEGKLMVRINPIHESTASYCDSKEEIEAVIDSGADMVMLPYFKTTQEVETFVKCVNERAKTMILVETAEAAENIDEILRVDGINEAHIGLNDLHLAYGKKFMFQLLQDGTVERLCNKFKKYNIRYGFGGIARVGYGMLPAEYIIGEHYRLGSEMAIVSRGFCDANVIQDVSQVEDIFMAGVAGIRKREAEVALFTSEEFEANRKMTSALVDKIVKK